MKPIETERLVLRQFELSDEEDVLAFLSNPEVSRYTGDAGNVQTIDDARAVIIDTWHADYRERGFGRLAVVDKTDDRVIGFCGLKYLIEINEIDIGYRFLPEYWGRGIATESARAAMRYGRDELKLKNIVGLVMPDNLASQHVLEKIGLQKSETMTWPGTEDLLLVYREPSD